METHIMREWKILVMLVVVLRSEVVSCWREEGRPRMVVDYLNQHAGKLNINIVRTLLLVQYIVQFDTTVQYMDMYEYCYMIRTVVCLT